MHWRLPRGLLCEVSSFSLLSDYTREPLSPNSRPEKRSAHSHQCCWCRSSAFSADDGDIFVVRLRPVEFGAVELDPGLSDRARSSPRWGHVEHHLLVAGRLREGGNFAKSCLRRSSRRSTDSRTGSECSADWRDCERFILTRKSRGGGVKKRVFFYNSSQRRLERNKGRGSYCRRNPWPSEICRPMSCQHPVLYSDTTCFEGTKPLTFTDLLHCKTSGKKLARTAQG